MLFVLTGQGKGKTTCAIGMGVRAAGAGRKVLMVQFLKSGKISENKVLAGIDNFQVKSFGRDICISKENVSDKDFELAKQGFQFAKKSLLEESCDFLILDEICVALHFGLFKEKEVLDFLSVSLRGALRRYSAQAPRRGNPTDIILTGRYCPQEIIEIADLVTELKEVKHHYQQNQKARKGIEY